MGASDAAGDDLWRTYVARPSAAGREALFSHYLPFARSVAGRVRRQRRGADIDIGDLHQWAAAGLLEAIDRFDPERGYAFTAFAARRISGSIQDGLSSSSELRRQASHKARLRTDRVRSLTQTTAGMASPEAAMNALADLVVDLALGFMLEEAGYSAGPEATSRAPTAYESLAWRQTVKRVSAAIQDIAEQERTVVRLHYLEGLEFVRIAEALSLSKGRISQIHASALAALRRRLPRLDNLQRER